MIAIVCILISIAMGAGGQIFIKKGLNNIGIIDFSNGFITAYMKIFYSPLILFGLVIYALGVFFWLYGLSKVDLSFAFPFVSLSYLMVFVLSWWFLGENISLIRWSGMIIICFGVFVVGRS